MTEMKVFVQVPNCGAFGTMCQIEDSPEDPLTKTFYLHPCPYSPETYSRGTLGTVAQIKLWPEEGRMTDSYRPVRVLDAPPGFVAAIVATMRPKPEARAPVSSVDPEVDRKAAAILMVLEEQPPMSMRALWKRVHAERFPAGMWDKCIQYLLDGGYIRFIEGGLLGQRRVEAVPKP